MGGPARCCRRASPYTARHLPGRQAHQHPAADRHPFPGAGPGQGLGRGGEPGREPRQSRRGEYRTRHPVDRKSTRLNSSHLVISYAVFCLKKKKKIKIMITMYKTAMCKYTK